MCQILPFTLPCCRRIYVEVSKLPSCPDVWPEKKCPPELCIQVRYEAEDRDAGTCWRCQAQIGGVVGQARENLRPEIDSAMIVHGLDEVGVSGRRRIAEEGGTCWYCGAMAGCQYCAPTKDEVGAEQENPDVAGKKRRREAVGRKGKAMNKRIKVEPRDNNNPQTPAFSYPNPELSSHWQNVVSTPYNNMSFSAGYGFTPSGGMAGFGIPWGQPFPPQVPGTTSVDWAAVQNDDNTHIGFEQGPYQNYSTHTPISGQQEVPNNPPYQSKYPNPGPASEQLEEPFLNRAPYQFQYPDPAPNAKSRIQSEVRSRPPFPCQRT